MDPVAANIVAEAFAKVAEEKSKYKPITVEKLIDLQYDLGSLLATDSNNIDTEKLSSDKEQYLIQLARDNTQLLLNKLWDLPLEKVEDTIVVKLPEQAYKLPREKHIPKPRPPTRWEIFAKEKGIEKKKKAKKTWDDVLQRWVPRYGQAKARAEKEKNWLLEVPANADPYEDQFEKRAITRKENIAKNEFNRLRNIAAAQKIKVPKMGLPPTDEKNSAQLVAAATIARVSTASLGKFQPTLRKEKPIIKENPIPGSKKRKLPPKQYGQEKKQQLEIVDRILNEQPTLDIDKGVNIHRKLQEGDEEGDGKRKRGKKGVGKPKNRKKPRGGKGQRNPKKRQIGRKRR